MDIKLIDVMGAYVEVVSVIGPDAFGIIKYKNKYYTLAGIFGGDIVFQENNFLDMDVKEETKKPDNNEVEIPEAIINFFNMVKKNRTFEDFMKDLGFK